MTDRPIDISELNFTFTRLSLRLQELGRKKELTRDDILEMREIHIIFEVNKKALETISALAQFNNMVDYYDRGYREPLSDKDYKRFGVERLDDD